MFQKQTKQLRYKRTIEFITDSLTPPAKILDLGTPNELGKKIADRGFEVQNTDFDFDKNPEKIAEYEVDVVTTFEVLEHLLNPLGVLEQINANRLFATVPLNLWFAKAYRNKNDPWDRHFHEFEDWQFDWLLDHAGWDIIRREKWNSPVGKIGIRPLLRLVTPRYYAVEAIRR